MALLSLTGYFDSLANLVSDSPWTYLLIFGLAALDVLFPVVPSETVVILSGVLAGTGHLNIGLVIAAAALGAFVGDNTGYWIGRTAGSSLAERYLKGDRRAQIATAEAQIQERGGYFIVIGRFVPGGRTVVVLACGLLKLSWAPVHGVRRDRRASSGLRRPASPATWAGGRSRTTPGSASWWARCWRRWWWARRRGGGGCGRGGHGGRNRRRLVACNKSHVPCSSPCSSRDVRRSTRRSDPARRRAPVRPGRPASR